MDEIVVLAIDDNEKDFLLLQRAFQQGEIKAQLVWAKDGLAGKEYLEKAALSRRLPVCIIIGLRLPGMDGFELLAYMKATAALNGVPVNVLSASSSPLDMARAYRLGAQTYFVKPSAPEALARMILAMQNQWTSSNPRPPHAH